jgi:hypothetical protein
MVLVGAACALALAVLVGVRAESARTGERTTTWRAPATSATPWRPLASSDRLGRLERHVGVHQPSSHGHWEGTRPTGKSPLPSKRLDSRDTTVARLDGRSLAHPRTLLWYASRPYAGRLADRPLIANCPAQGPPRTA